MTIKRQVLARFSTLVLSSLLFVAACQRPPQANHDEPPAQAAPVSHDLSQDEAAGGHTLRRHVGRSDAELRQRLDREPDISAASAYTDRETAERVVATVLQEQAAKIERWFGRPGGHPNLVLDYRGDPAHPIGHTLHRGETAAQPCSDAIVVLRWDGDRHYHVLTSYPECR